MVVDVRGGILVEKKREKIWLKYVANKKMLETYVGTRQNLNFAPKKAHMLGEKYVNVHAPLDWLFVVKSHLPIDTKNDRKNVFGNFFFEVDFDTSCWHP